MAKVMNDLSYVLCNKLVRGQQLQEHLTALRNHHTDSYGHSLRVGLLAIDLGYENEIADPELRLLGYSGLLHDIGKLMIPVKILSKEGPLNEQEREIMNQHPLYSLKILNGFDPEIVREIVVAHHEFKEKAYPRSGNERRETPRDSNDRRQKNDSVETLAQIVAVADVYDALANSRAYKAPFSIEKIEEILRTDFTGASEYINQVLERHKE